jgi:hypothetical protein
MPATRGEILEQAGLAARPAADSGPSRPAARETRSAGSPFVLCAARGTGADAAAYGTCLATIRAVATRLGHADHIILSRRGSDHATALETAHRIEETGRVAAMLFSTLDLLHGPIAMAGPGARGCCSRRTASPATTCSRFSGGSGSAAPRRTW